jgi:hypothetical protein
LYDAEIAAYHGSGEINMSLDSIAYLPGGQDINDQFLRGVNIKKSLSILKRMTGHGGHYQFGALTADFYDYRGQERQQWLDEAGTYPTDVKDKIKNAIVQALSHQDTNGNPDPIQVILKWTQNGGSPDVNVTYDPAAPSYTIEILNCVQPMVARLAERRQRKKE